MRIYICSPYAANDDFGVFTNVEFAKECCRAVFDAGYDPYAAHLFYPQFCDDKKTEERARCMEAAKRELLLCDGMMVFGEDISAGMREEIEFADNNGVPIYDASRNDIGLHVFNAAKLFTVEGRLKEAENGARKIKFNYDANTPKCGENYHE